MASGVQAGRSEWFLCWALVGAGCGLGGLTMLSIGVFVLPIALAGAILLARHEPARASAAGLLSGIGLPLLYVGYLNREGPGTVCHSTAIEQSCVQEYSPWPWVAAGLALVGLGIALFVVRRSSGDRQRAGERG